MFPQQSTIAELTGSKEALEAQCRSLTQNMADLEAKAKNRPATASCDCNKTMQQLMEDSSRQPVAMRFSNMPADKQLVAQVVFAAELSRGREDFHQAAEAVVQAFEERYTGTWCASVGFNGRFSVSCHAAEASVFMAAVGPLKVVLFQTRSS